MMIINSSRCLFLPANRCISPSQVNATTIDFYTRISNARMLLLRKPTFHHVTGIQCSSKSIVQHSSSTKAIEKAGKKPGKNEHHLWKRKDSAGKNEHHLWKRKDSKKPGKNEHHLWKRKDSAGSGRKAMNLVRIVSGLPKEKETVYRVLDEWIAWELEFPVIAAAKALRILKNHRQWLRVIQVAKWMLSKGQGTTMATYDIVLLAYDQQSRIEEAGSLWSMILHTHTRSISKRLFSRMISLYHHHDRSEKIIEIFGDMEELGVKPDEDTVRRVAQAFEKLGEDDRKSLVIDRYGCKWKYVHFKGERARVRRDPLVD